MNRGNQALARVLRVFPESVRAVVLTAILSLAAGLSAVAFLILTNLLFSRTFISLASRSRTEFVLGSLLVILSSSLLAGFLLNVFAPEAAGSGIPQVKAAFWKELGHMPFPPVLVKFVAGVISIGGGASLGREGPSVFLGGGAASNLAGLLGIPRRERRGAMVMGASSGLAAAFNSPLAAITFAIEEIVGDLNSRYLGGVVLASLGGAFVVYAIIGRQPAFSLPSIENVSWLHYAVVPLVALLASLAGVAFQRAALFWRGRFKAARKIPAWLRPALGAFVTWVLGTGVFLGTGKLGVFGLGYRDLSDALRNGYAWRIAGLVLVAKLIATVASYSSGGCGGIFAPMLFVGGMTGTFVGGLMGSWVPMTPADHIVLAVVGMSACLGAVVRAPLTSLLIVFEMTHQFSLVPGLMMGAIISQAASRLAGRLNFYDALLVQDGHELHKIRPPHDLQSWQNLAVNAIANPRPVVLRDPSPEVLRDVIGRYPYNAFPLVIDGVLSGVVFREQILSALHAGTPPEVRKAVTCHPDQTVREVGDMFIESPGNVLVVVAREDGGVRGIITLHDLIRAQAAVQA